MDLFSYPTLGECALDVITNKNCLVRTVQNASRELYTVYAESLMANGFVEKEYKEKGGRLFAAYKNGTDAVFLTYHPAICELCLVFEKKTL